MSKQPSPELLAELKETFNMFDVDGDGCITAQQLKTVMVKLGYKTEDGQLDKMLKQMDKDGNGTIELNQYLDVVGKQAANKGLMDEATELQALFGLFDKNGDGLISADELKDGFQILGGKGDNIAEDDIQELLNAVDIDGDGHINFEQFCKMLKLK